MMTNDQIHELEVLAADAKTPERAAELWQLAEAAWIRAAGAAKKSAAECRRLRAACLKAASDGKGGAAS